MPYRRQIVIRHEAMAIRRARSDSVASEDLDLDELVPGPERSVEDVVASSERVRRSAEALRALKPDEATALMMKAHGLSYEEIGERNGWSYTKVNRAITEGRRRFMAAYEGIESGEECARLAGIVETLAAGEATTAQIVQIRPHLRHCAACRAAIRDLHLSRLHRASLFWPAFLASSPGRYATLKHHVSDFFRRTQASDVATAVQISTSSGGGRLATVATILGICLSSAGVGTVCVVTGAVSDPFGIFDKHHARTPRTLARAHVAAATPAPVHIVRARATATPRPTPTPQVRRHTRRHATRSSDPAQGTKPKSHENAPISPALTTASGADSFTPEAPQANPAPAAAPATGGDEFTP